MTATAHINAIGTAVPPHQVHDAFVGFVRSSLQDSGHARLFDRMVARSGIERRFSFIEPEVLPDGRITDRDRFYGLGDWPTTGERMIRYERDAPALALQAVRALSPDIAAEGVTHLVLASCTGFVAPGLDQLLVAQAGIDPAVERTVVGFMGCYAAVNALRLAHHIVRSEPEARVLVVNLELCTIHFQRTRDLEKLLSMLLFGDGAAAALVTAEPRGIALTDFRCAAISGSGEAITWRIGDQGFDMHLDGQVPNFIANALRSQRSSNDDGGLFRGVSPAHYDLWAVHAGGRTILDAVERALDLPPEALHPSREVLRRFGNMSSATLMFVLAAMIDDWKSGSANGGANRAQGQGMAMAFGPGLAAETFRFRMAPS
ncbi:MAG: stilbene synthase [Novosphingobium lindaniclasticum]|jgi:predicted naringenin-chalcone synthase|uniref:type III polyketide synthase n=1 Tax=Novosphingobium lindaniclasticum TaxID=1329895 RepID=UPI002409D508|nr:type III polyketide synthase [Novosphingobium lindaniclasticum]MDF2638675.1 stilbene synthase [Novosphingobium lindaniclasticum]